ncbi:diaminopimelate epimerase [Rhizobium sp. ARZ01]|uniref:diaminopimelate epimerase n=1 Tax=Rhizobium sp. ARZ01 TaxID=2769313 RepID=UPI001FEF9402|nr:diaminopimelate epimerase [Rhizobium sp. ARZ01]
MLLDIDYREAFSSPERSFIKTHGLGNDFVVMDGRHHTFVPSEQAIRWICDRHRGVGGDQLLVFEQPQRPDANVRLRIYNIDGVEAQTCLNATRCAAWLLMEESGAGEVVIETIGGPIRARREGDHRVSLHIVSGEWDWRKIPLAGPLEEARGRLDNGPLKDPVAVNMGNPHLVYFVADRDSLDVAALADPIQKNRYLPEQANIGVAELVGGGRIRLVVYERPGILTQACGSGACAAVLAALRKGLIEHPHAIVDMPGGSLDVRVLQDETIILTGDVAVSFYGFTAQELV